MTNFQNKNLKNLFSPTLFWNNVFNHLSILFRCLFGLNCLVSNFFSAITGLSKIKPNNCPYCLSSVFFISTLLRKGSDKSSGATFDLSAILKLYPFKIR